MFRSLLQKRSSEMQIRLQSSLAYLADYERINQGVEYSVKRKASLQEMFSSSQHIFYIVNVDNNHWICLCLSMELQRIFSVDSQNSYNTGQSKASEVIRVLREHFDIRDIEWVRLISPHQRDGYSCGIFTALNSAFLLKSILEGSFTSDGPTDIKKWGNKIFTEEDKLSIRMCAKDVIIGDKDVTTLLDWLN
jgi:Ulp1 family protease